MVGVVEVVLQGKKQFLFSKCSRQEVQMKRERNKSGVLLARLGSLVGLAMPGSIPRTSGGSIGFPRYRLEEENMLVFLLLSS